MTGSQPPASAQSLGTLASAPVSPANPARSSQAIASKAIASKAPVRLKKRAQFLHVAKGARRHCETFTVQSAPRVSEVSGDKSAHSDHGPRFGLTVTRKIGNAVVRNKIKRRLREALRLTDHGGHQDCDYVIVARLPALNCDFERLGQDLQRTIRQLHDGNQKRSKTGQSSGPHHTHSRPAALSFTRT
ncbi:MAG: ribonuclease P protein component [Alphaproteobacteria bacterium]|nr:ribonuclease P protein component [Alphaproteobacteria bacterium]